jgi:hypothetical protein
MGGKTHPKRRSRYANGPSNSTARAAFDLPAPLPQNPPGARVHTQPTKYKWLAKMRLGDRATTYGTTAAASRSIA